MHKSSVPDAARPEKSRMESAVVSSLIIVLSMLQSYLLDGQKKFEIVAYWYVLIDFYTFCMLNFHSFIFEKPS